MRRKGHAMLELAASAGVMFSFLAGTFQFGYTFYIYDQLVSAVGNGGRYAAQRTYHGELEKDRTAIRNMVIYGDAQPAADAVPIVPGLKPEQVQVDWIGGDSGAPSAVDVMIVNYTVPALFGSFTFNKRPMAEFPFVGRYEP